MKGVGQSFGERVQSRQERGWFEKRVEGGEGRGAGLLREVVGKREVEGFREI